MINEALELLMHRDATLTEDALRGYYTDDADLQILLDAERYSLFAGGKRIRPIAAQIYIRQLGIHSAQVDHQHGIKGQPENRRITQNLPGVHQVFSCQTFFPIRTPFNKR